jgi:hypothetical protein
MQMAKLLRRASDRKSLFRYPRQDKSHAKFRPIIHPHLKTTLNCHVARAFMFG